MPFSYATGLRLGGADVTSTEAHGSSFAAVTMGRSLAGHALPSCPTSRCLLRTQILRCPSRHSSASS